MKTDKKTSYLEELNYLNAICCLLVILLHVLSIGITNADPGSFKMLFIYMPWRIAAFAVPAFIFSSAVKVSYNLEQTGRENYFSYIWKRIKKIYIPYVIWCLVYYSVFYKINYVRGDIGELLTYLLDGTLSAQFYYIIVIMQFYLLRPLWSFALRKVPWYISVSCAALLNVIMIQAPGFLSALNINFAYTDRIFPSYILFWVIGLYVGKYYVSFRESLIKNRRSLVFAALVILFLVTMQYLQFYSGKYFFDFSYVKLFMDCVSIILLFALCLCLNKAPQVFKKLLGRIHKASFSVYLSHCLFLVLITSYLQNHGVESLKILIVLRFAVCFTAPFALYELLKLIKSGTGSLVMKIKGKLKNC